VVELRNKEFDAVIEAALREQPLQPTPLLLHRRITRGVRIAVLRQHEQARCRRILGGAALLALAMVFAAVAAVVATHLTSLLRPGLAGGMGWLDYYSTSITVAWQSYTGAYSLVVAVLLAGGAFLVALIPFGLSQRGH
jgi:uncharacterized membrane protein YbjE (DUF340 family)